MTVTPSENPISRLLNDKAIRHFAVIDDAFGPPVLDDFGNILETFWADVESDVGALEELAGISGSTLSGVGDLTDAVLEKVWNARTALKALAPFYRKHLAPTVEGKLAPLTALVKLLQDDLGREVTSHASLKSFVDTKPRIIFLDFYMGPAGQEASVRRAKDTVAGITEKYARSGVMPLLVLMSSADITSELVSEFRRSTGWLGGMFYFIPKRDFTRKERMCLLLGTWAMGLPEGHKIQKFVEALEESVRKAADDFLVAVRSLTLEDYGNIQRLSLQEDGHPLGDYLLWLFGSYFASLLFHSQPAVRKHRAELDSLWIESAPPSQHPPSVLLAEMYRSAIFDSSVDDIGPHPLSLGGMEERDAPIIRLGDLFIRDASNEVLLVISPECDLAFSPRGKRQCDPEQSVLLMPGQLQPVGEPIPQGENLRTELFEFEGMAYRILWNKKQVRSERFGRIAGCLSSFKYERKARLRLPYALQIQQSFASDLTRVGMPVAPPIYRPMKLRAYYEGGDGSHAVLHEARDDAAFLVLGRNGTHFVLTVQYVLWLQEQFETIASACEARKAVLAGSSPSDASKYATRARDVRSFAGNYDVLLKLLEPIHVQNFAKKKELVKKLLVLAPDGDFSGAYDPKDPPITIVLQDSPTKEETE